jgi:hypothetical protein
MRTFAQLRNKKMPKGEHVFSKRINRHTVMVHKEKNQFVVYINNEKLDTYRSQEQAKKMGVAFAKEM